MSTTSNNNNETPSPTRNNIQLEICTEDGGSMNIQRELTLEKLSLSSGTVEDADRDFGNGNVEGCVEGGQVESVSVNNNNEGSVTNEGITNNNNNNNEGDELINRSTTKEEAGEENNYYGEESTMNENDMSVLTDVIDNYYPASADNNTADNNNSVSDNNNTAADNKNSSQHNRTESFTNSIMGGLDISNHTTAVYDAVASFLSGGSPSLPTVVDPHAAATTSANGTARATTATTTNTTAVSRTATGPAVNNDEETTQPILMEGVQVDMLTGAILDSDEVDDASRHTIGTTSISTRSHRDVVLDTSITTTDVSVTSGLTTPSQVMTPLTSVVSKKESEGYYNLVVGKDSMKEGDGDHSQLQQHQQQQEQQDDIRNSNSDEYCNAHSHESHYHDDSTTNTPHSTNTNDDGIREGLETLSSEWLPPEERGGLVLNQTLSAQSLLGGSMKSLMDGSDSTEDSSGVGIDVPLSSRRGVVRGGGDGRGGTVLNSGGRVSRSLLEDPLLGRGGGHSLSSSSTSSSQNRDGSSSGSGGGSSHLPPRHEYYTTSKQKTDDSSSLNSDLMELHHGVPMSSPMAGETFPSSTANDNMPMELSRGVPIISPMSRNSDMMELHRGLPMSSPASRNSSMMELHRGAPLSTKRGSIDDSMNSGMMRLQHGAPMIGEASTNSEMMELQHGVSMSQDTSDSPDEAEYQNPSHQDRVHSPIRRREEAIHTMAEALSLHNQYQSTPQNIIIDTKKPDIPDSYPSLMDALQSGSSFGSVTTATQSVGIKMPNSALQEKGREYIDLEAEEILNVQDDDDDDEGRRENSLTYTEFDNTQQLYQVEKYQEVQPPPSLPAMELPPLPTDSGNVDPRMNIDYQRHYIVDLQPINEEGTNASRSGVTPEGNPPRDGADGMNNNVTIENAEQVLRQQQQLLQQPYQPTSEEAANDLRQQQQYYHTTQAPHQLSNQFFNYRHQYYQERYQDDNETAQTSRYDDDTDSTCSSVTLSQAFHGSDFDSCESSVGMNSSVSSITFSHVDQHEHDQGFYIATKLGDFVHVPDEVDISEQSQDSDTSNLKTEEEEKFPAIEPSSTNTTTTADNTDEVSNTTAAPNTTLEANDNDKQVGKTSEEMTSDLIASIVPECGVPIPSVMAKVGHQPRRRKSSNTGFLVPWHSSRSIQNYHFGNQRKKGGRQQRNSSNSSLFSIGSVHTFRG